MPTNRLIARALLRVLSGFLLTEQNYRYLVEGRFFGEYEP